MMSLKESGRYLLIKSNCSDGFFIKCSGFGLERTSLDNVCVEEGNQLCNWISNQFSQSVLTIYRKNILEVLMLSK